MLKYIPIIDLKKITLHFLEVFHSITGRCNVVIDGIDHAARMNDNWNKTYLSELPTNSELPEGVKFIVVGQPDYEYPIHITNDSKVLNMPEISKDDVKIMLEDINNKKISNDVLASLILKEVGSNTLNVIFSIKEVSKIGNDFDIEGLINILNEKN